MTEGLPRRRGAFIRRLVPLALAGIVAVVIFASLQPGLTPQSSPTTPECTPSTSAAPQWIDDFDGPAGSAPNPANWVAAEGAGGWGNDELQTYTAANAALDGQSHLVITANINRSAPAGQRYTSARLSSVPDFTTGRLSARIKLPDGVGLLPAFWAMGSDLSAVGWPAAGEIDVVETPTTTTASVHSIHAPSTFFALTPAKESVDVKQDPPLSSDFHVYWVDRSPGRIVIGIDSETVATFTRQTTAADMDWVFDKPFNALFSLAIGGTWPGSPDATTPDHSKMTIDWIRLDPLCSGSN